MENCEHKLHELNQDLARYIIELHSALSVLQDLVNDLYDIRDACNKDGVEWCRLDSLLAVLVTRVEREKVGKGYSLKQGDKHVPFHVGHVCDGCDLPTKEAVVRCLRCGKEPE